MSQPDSQLPTKRAAKKIAEERMAQMVVDAKAALTLPTNFDALNPNPIEHPLVVGETVIHFTLALEGFMKQYNTLIKKPFEEVTVEADVPEGELTKMSNPDERGLTDQMMYYILKNMNGYMDLRNSTQREEGSWGYDQMWWFRVKYKDSIVRVIMILQAKVVKTVSLDENNIVPSIDFTYGGLWQMKSLGEAIEYVQNKVDNSGWTGAAKDVLVLGGYVAYHQNQVYFIPQADIAAHYNAEAEKHKQQDTRKLSLLEFNRNTAQFYMDHSDKYPLRNIGFYLIDLIEKREAKDQMFGVPLLEDASVPVRDLVQGEKPKEEDEMEEEEHEFPQKVVQMLEFNELDESHFKTVLDKASGDIATYITSMQGKRTPDERGLTDLFVVSMSLQPAVPLANTNLETLATRGDYPAVTIIPSTQSFENVWGYDHLWSYAACEKLVVLLLQAKVVRSGKVNFAYSNQMSKLVNAMPKIIKAIENFEPAAKDQVVVVPAYMIYSASGVQIIPVKKIKDKYPGYLDALSSSSPDEASATILAQFGQDASCHASAFPTWQKTFLLQGGKF